MKKQKQHKLAEETEDSKSVVDTERDAPEKQEDPEQDIDAQKLSEIESTEVAPEDGHEESIDPDKLVTIVRKAPRHSTVVWWKQRKYIIPLGGLFLVVLLLAIPMTRFLMLGWVWRENVTITIIDSSNNAPVTDAAVTIADKSGLTDSRGRVTLSAVPIGFHKLKVEKPNYKTLDAPVTVDVFSSPLVRPQTFVATGRPQTFQVVDRLTGKPIAEATVTDSKGATLARTNGDGRATVVVPVNKKELDLSVAAGKYRVLTAKLSVETKTLHLVPDGALYFLSKQSGKIDVVKSNLDGSDRKVIVQGTGDEVDSTTTLLASRDWKYLVLKAKRAPNKPESLFLIDTSNDSMKLLDEGNVAFTLIGWSGHSFLYEVNRQYPEYWSAKLAAVKSYDAEKGSVRTIDENANDPASNSITNLYENLGNYYIVENRLIYTKTWLSSGNETLSREGKRSVIISVRPDGTDKKTVKDFPATTTSYMNAQLYTPQEITFRIADKSNPVKYTYGELEESGYKALATADFGKEYPTYLMSPSSNASLWYEERDGKNAIFVGDKNAGEKQEIVSKSEFKPYGWLTDEYILLQKKDSELYVTTKAQFQAGAEPLKVSDYHKTRAEILGYGYGYGGQ